MYLDYFALDRPPFRITPDTSLFFSGGNQGRGVVLEAMLFAIANGEGILKVVGEVGSGKTMLCRMLEERLPDSTEVVYLANPNLSPEDILYAVAFELKLPVRRDTSKLLVMQQLQNHLLKQHAANKNVLVIIEEAQGMPIETLEEIRLFSNLETHRDKLMQIILFGQPELDRNISTKNIRQLRERITHSFYLNPLSTHEVAEYIQFRLSAAGCPSPKLLTAKAEWLISKASGGLTRRINILADKALLAAYAGNALAEQTRVDASTQPVVGWRHVYAAMRDSDYSIPFWQALFTPLRLMSASMVVMAVTMVFLIWPSSSGVASQLPLDAQLPVQLGEFATAVEAASDADHGTAQSAPLVDAMIENSVEAVTTEDKFEPLSGFTEEVVAVEVQPVEDELPKSAEAAAQPMPNNQDLDAEIAALEGERSNRNLVQERVLASISWLRDSNGLGYTVQFLSGETQNLSFAESFLGELETAGFMTDAYMCMSASRERSYWTIKYGNFTGLSLAQKFVDELPNSLHDYKPFVQNMSNVECNTNNTIAALILE